MIETTHLERDHSVHTIVCLTVVHKCNSEETQQTLHSPSNSLMCSMCSQISCGHLINIVFKSFAYYDYE